MGRSESFAFGEPSTARAFDADKLTDAARAALDAAARLADELHHRQVEPEHLLDILARPDLAIVPTVLAALGVWPARVQHEPRRALAMLERTTWPAKACISRRLGRVLAAAQTESERLGFRFILTEHPLLSLADMPESGPAGEILRGLGATRDRIVGLDDQVRQASLHASRLS